MTLDVKTIEASARAEIVAEDFRAAVDKKKLELRTRKPLLRRLFPWKITITKR